jgi:hypothetical protein
MEVSIVLTKSGDSLTSKVKKNVKTKLIMYEKITDADDIDKIVSFISY